MIDGIAGIARKRGGNNIGGIVNATNVNNHRILQNQLDKQLDNNLNNTDNVVGKNIPVSFKEIANLSSEVDLGFLRGRFDIAEISNKRLFFLFFRGTKVYDIENNGTLTKRGEYIIPNSPQSQSLSSSVTLQSPTKLPKNSQNALNDSELPSVGKIIKGLQKNYLFLLIGNAINKKSLKIFTMDDNLILNPLNTNLANLNQKLQSLRVDFIDNKIYLFANGEFPKLRNNQVNSDEFIRMYSANEITDDAENLNFVNVTNFAVSDTISYIPNVINLNNENYFYVARFSENNNQTLTSYNYLFLIGNQSNYLTALEALPSYLSSFENYSKVIKIDNQGTNYFVDSGRRLSRLSSDLSFEVIDETLGFFLENINLGSEDIKFMKINNRNYLFHHSEKSIGSQNMRSVKITEVIFEN